MKTRSQFKVIKVLHARGCVNEKKAYSVKKLAEEAQLSVPTIRKCIYYLNPKGYVKEGMLNHHKKTYYVSAEGIKKIEELE